MKEYSVLITGAAGSVGKDVLRQLYAKQSASSITVFVQPSKKTEKVLKSYPGINVVYGTITDFEDVKRACQNQDYVIHLAAIIPPLADDEPTLTNLVNIEGTRNLVTALEEVSPDAFLLYSSSVACYGDRGKMPDIYTTDALIPSVGDEYAVTKIAAEKIIRESKLNWAIYRLSAIMGIGNHKISKLMFHMPLDTVMEICTVEDTARAFVHSIGKKEELLHRTFNLGGGESCRIVYNDFLTRAFHAYGMGKVDFPANTFAKINFHCGNYADGMLLEEILQFRSDTIDSYFERFSAAVPRSQRFVTKLFNKPVKKVLLRSSEPLQAIKNNNKEMIERFFGTD